MDDFARRYYDKTGREFDSIGRRIRLASDPSGFQTFAYFSADALRI